MNSYNNDATLFNVNHNEIIKRTNSKQTIIALLLLIAGLCACLIGLPYKDTQTSIFLTVFIIGLLIIGYGCFRLMNKSKEFVYTKTNSKIIKKTLLFDMKNLVSLQRDIESGSFTENKLESIHNGNVRMDVLMSEDGNFAGVQLFSYQSYLFAPVTSIHYFNNEKAQAFQQYVTHIITK